MATESASAVLGAVQSILAPVRARIDDIYTVLSETRGTLLETLTYTIRTIIPTQLELQAGAIKAFGDLSTGLVDSLATLPEYSDAIWKGSDGAALVAGTDDVRYDRAAIRDVLGLPMRGATESAGISVLLEDPPVPRVGPRARRPTPEQEADTLRGTGRSLLRALGLVAGAGSLMSAAITSDVSDMTQQALKDWSNTPLEPGMAIDAGWRLGKEREWLASEAKLSGIDSERLDAMIAVHRPLLSPIDAVLAERRDIAPGGFAAAELARAGYTDEQAEALRRLVEYQPPPQDIVMMAGREAFEPDQVATLRLDEEFSFADDPIIRRSAIDPEVLRLFWRAHWEMPSPEMFYRMYHRGIIDADGLNSAFRQRDIAPYWRDKLQQLSYDPLTRVDVRRMHQLGELEDADVLRAYKDVGYSDVDAERLLRFTVALTARSRSAETARITAPLRSTIIKAYAGYTLTRGAAADALAALGLEPERVEALLAAVEAQRAVDRSDSVLAAAERLYVSAVWDAGAVSDYLSAQQIPGESIPALLLEWEPLRLARTLTDSERQERDLTKGETLAGYREGLSDAAETVTALLAIGYDQTEADRLVALEAAKLRRTLRSAAEGAARSQYLRRRLDVAGVTERLTAAGVAPERQGLLLDRWLVERETAEPDLPITWLEALARDGLMSDAELRSELDRRGYSAVEVGWISQLWEAKDVATGARLALDTQRLAQSRTIETERQALTRELAAGRRAAGLEQVAGTLAARLQVEDKRAQSQAAQADRQLAGADRRLEVTQAGQMRLAEARSATQRTLQAERLALQRAIASERLGADKTRLEKEFEARASALAAQAARQDRQLAAGADRVAAETAGRFKLAEARAGYAATADLRRASYQQASDTRRAAAALTKESVNYARKLELQQARAGDDQASATARASAISAAEAAVRAILADLLRTVSSATPAGRV